MKKNLGSTTNEFGNKLKIIRKTAHFTQEQVATKINCEKSKISKIENGLQSPSISDLNLLFNLYYSKMTEEKQKDYSLYWLFSIHNPFATNAVRENDFNKKLLDEIADLLHKNGIK